jgi:hypothetical protein
MIYLKLAVRFSLHRSADGFQENDTKTKIVNLDLCEYWNIWKWQNKIFSVSGIFCVTKLAWKKIKGGKKFFDDFVKTIVK